MNPSTLKKIVPVLAIAGLLLMILWMAGSFDEKIQPGTNKPQGVDISQAVEVVSRQQPTFEPVPASIEAKQATIVSSRILAQIETVQVRAGDMVKKGQKLVQLDNADLKSRVSQANATLQSVTARLAEAKLSLSRAVDLRNKNLLAQSDLDKAQANHDALVADQANATQALSEARSLLGFATIVAPIDGRIVDRFAEPGDTAKPGVQLLSLYNPLSLRVEANVREQLAVSLKKGQQLDVVIPALNQTLKSELEELVPAGNVGSRSFLVKSRLQQFENLLPGMYAQLLIPAGIESELVMPEQYVARVGQLDIAWVVTEGQLERRYIRTGKRYADGMISVVSGLNAGEMVVPFEIATDP